MKDTLHAEQYAQMYDASVADWPGEIDFYSRLAQESVLPDEPTIEAACGTGRVAIQLGLSGISVLGFDHSPQMLSIARRKSKDLPSITWLEADMRTFELPGRSGLFLIPGHSFQNLLTVTDQMACLQQIRQHLSPGGLLCLHLDHQDVDWLGDLVGEGGGKYELTTTSTHPQSGNQIRTFQAWWYERSTQTVSLDTAWEELGADGDVVQRTSTGPIPIHAIFPFEVEHMLQRVGLQPVALYGDFYGSDFTEQSSEMIWIARRAP